MTHFVLLQILWHSTPCLSGIEVSATFTLCGPKENSSRVKKKKKKR